MTDEHEHAMKVWREACGESQEAFYRIGEQPNDPESIKQGQLADQAAAAVIAADRAGLVAEIERLREALSLDAVRFEHCAEMIAKSFEASGTLRAERTIKAEHYALEARAALKDTRHD